MPLMSSPLDEHDAGPSRRNIFHTDSLENCGEKTTLKVARWQMSHFGRPPIRMIGLAAVGQRIVYKGCASFDSLSLDGEAQGFHLLINCY